MKKAVVYFLFCAWVLLEPPIDKRTNRPVEGAPFKTWKIPTFGNKGSAMAYFDTKKDCDSHRAIMILGDEKVCFPVDQLGNR